MASTQIDEIPKYAISGASKLRAAIIKETIANNEWLITLGPAPFLKQKTTATNQNAYKNLANANVCMSERIFPSRIRSKRVTRVCNFFTSLKLLRCK